MTDNLTELSPFPPVVSSPDDKRIVFQHTQGPLAGLYRIMGVCSEFGLKPDEALPSAAEGFEVAGTVIEFASLVRDTGRWALYRELIPFEKPQKGFDERQV